MAQLEKFNKLISYLRKRASDSVRDDDVSVAVGFTAQYAIYVHEMIEMKHAGEPRPSKKGVFWGPSLTGPKFLERPARELQSVLAKIVADGKRAGMTLAKTLLMAGYRLQREAMMRVPVEYGNLRASAFTRLEKGKEQ